MRFLADMGVSMHGVQSLRDHGHDARHLREEGLERLPNGEIFLKAAVEKCVVLTFDLDFGEIVALSRSAPVPVVVFRLYNTRAPHVINRLTSVLQLLPGELDSACVIVVEESRHRIRRFPSEMD